MSTPTLTPPGGQGSIKDGDLLVIGGSTDPGATVLAARLVNTGDDSTAQAIADGTIQTTTDGTFVGVVTATGLTDNTTVELEVVVIHLGLESAPDQSRSAPEPVDNSPPGTPTVMVQEGSQVAVPPVTVVANAIGADEVFIDGQITDGANVRSWVPLAGPIAVSLTPTNGSKAIVARFRDSAHNEAQATTSINLDADAPLVSATVASPWMVDAIKDGDMITVGGTTTNATAVELAELVDLDAGAAPLAGCRTDVTTSVTAGAMLGGSINVGTRCPAAVMMRLDVTVRSGSGILSSVAISNTLGVDNTPPAPASAAVKQTPTVVGNATRNAGIELTLDATDGGGGTQFRIEGDVSSGRINSWEDFLTSPADEPVTLTTAQGMKTVTVTFRDDVRNVSAPVNLMITLDSMAPPPPAAADLLLVEQSATPNDPMTVGDAFNTYTLSGTVASDATQILVYGDAAGLNLLQTLMVGMGAFMGVVPYVAGETYHVGAVDAAGNESMTRTAVMVPTFTMLGASPQPASTVAPVIITFTASTTLAANPTVTVDGNGASFVSEMSGDYTYTYGASSGEAEGPLQAVVRVVGEDGTATFQIGTTGTTAVPITLDFTPPITTLHTGPMPASNTNFAVLEFGCNEVGCNFECNQGMGFMPCGSPAVLTDLDWGNYSFLIRATDPAGNLEITPVAAAWTVRRNWVGAAAAGPGGGGGSSNGSHSCALTELEEVWCWGLNEEGALGDGSIIQRDVPFQAGAARGWTDIDADTGTTCAVRADGTLWCWGYAFRGKSGIGADDTLPHPAPAPVVSQPTLPDTWRQVDVGFLHACAVNSADEAYCWGQQTYGQLGNGSTALEISIVRESPGGQVWDTISAGFRHTCAVRTDTTLYCWGQNPSTGYVLGFATTGTYATPQQVGVGGMETGWVSVAAGGGHTCGIYDGGSGPELYCWGDNANGQLGLGNTMDAGTPAQVGMAMDWVMVDAGTAHTCGIRGPGLLYCWGANGGRLGDGGTMQRDAPRQVGTETDWIDVSCGAGHTCGVRANAELYCWGANSDDELAQGPAGMSSYLSPVEVPRF